MNWLWITAIAFGLAMDAFVVSIAAGLTVRKITPGHVFRISFSFGLFQFFMPVVGWWAGRTVFEYITGYDHWIAFGLLSFVGGKMLLDALRRGHGGDSKKTDPTQGLTLLTLSIATSIDALAVGLSMAFLNVSIWTLSIVIGVVAAGMSFVGISFGGKIGQQWGRYGEIVGGFVLIGIGLHILISHLQG